MARYGQIKIPLIHILRNSIDHGIELPQERKEAGKNPVGKITVSAKHRENKIIINITDDGRGLDVEKIKGEMGDVCWYLAEIATALNFNFEDVFTGNIEKLSKRYPEGFDKERSIHRKELGIE